MVRRLLGLVIPCATLLTGCGSSDESPSSSGGVVDLAGGNYAVHFDPASTSVSLSRGSDVLLTFPADALQLGRVDAIEDSKNYDPYPLVTAAAGASEPVGLRWLSVVSVKVTSRSSSALSLALTHDEGRRSTLDVSVNGEGSFTAKWLPAAEGDAIAYLRLRPVVSATENFYGLGEYYDSVAHRGKVRAMQLELNGKLESSDNEAHVPVPFVIGTRGWGLFVENSYPASFDVAATDAERVDVQFGTGAASNDGLTFHLFAAEKPLDVTKRYYDLSGYPRIPARWALGPWIWRDENKDQAEVESDLDTIRDLDLATTALWIDRPYATAVNTFDFNAPQFPTPDAMIKKAHDLGFRLALWHSPYLDEQDPKAQALIDEATSKDYYPIEKGILLNGWGRPIDLTKPEAYAWWQSLIHKYTDNGIEGFKMDYGEDIVPGVFGARNVWRFHDGSDERTMHRGFTLLYHSVYAEALPEDGYFLLCRAGKYGDQKNVSVIWPGDLDARFWKQGEKVTEGGTTFNAVGGLPASMIAGMSLGPSGFPFYGADTGGYRHSPPDKETFRRWFEQTALSSVMQIGTSSNDVAWQFNDQELLDSYRVYTRLHLRLFPYEWTLAQQIKDTGYPIERPLGLAYPELGADPDDEYLFGADLLVAPVVDAGKTARDVLFPPGQWVHWWTGEVVEGGATRSVAAPLGSSPLHQRVGSIVPLLRPTIDAMAPTTDPTRVDSYATTPGVLYPRVAAGAASSFTLFDGTLLSQQGTSSAITLHYTGGSDFKLGASFEVVAVGGKPASVSIDGNLLGELASLAALEAAATGWAFDAANGGSLHVKVGPGDHAVSVSR